MPFTTFIGMLCFCAIDAPMAACGPSTSWSTALPMSCSRPPIFAALTSAPELGGHDRREVARLDAVDEHVLAVARAVLEPPQELDELGGETGDAGLVGRLLAGLADHEVDLGLGLVDDLLDATGMDPAVGDELGQRQARDLAADGIEARQHDRLGGVVDDQVDAGGLLERADVAALAADDPALHLVAREMDDGHGVLRRVVGGDALHRGHDDLAGLLLGLLARAPLDRPRQLDRVVLGLLANRLEQHALGVLRGQPGHALEGDDLLADQPGELLALLLEVALAVVDLAALLLEQVGALVELLVAREQAPLEVLQLGALRPGLVLGLAPEPELLVLRLEDHVLLLGPSLGDDPGGLVLGGLHGLGRPHAAGDEPHGNADDGGDNGRNGDERAPSSVPPTRRTVPPEALAYQVRATPHRRSLGLGTG